MEQAMSNGISAAVLVIQTCKLSVGYADKTVEVDVPREAPDAVVDESAKVVHAGLVVDTLRASLCRGEFSSLSLTWNDHAVCYQSVADEFANGGYPDHEFVGGAKEKTRCIERNSLWTATWHPDTPVCSCTLRAADLHTLLLALVRHA